MNGQGHAEVRSPTVKDEESADAIAELANSTSVANPSSIAYSSTQERSAVLVQWPSGRTKHGFFTSNPKVCAHEKYPNSRCNAALSNEDSSSRGNAAPSAKIKQLTFSASLKLQSRKQSFSHDTQPQSVERITNSDTACADSSVTSAELVLKNDLDADSQFKNPISLPGKQKLSELRDPGLSVSGKRINSGELGPQSPASPTMASPSISGK